MHFIGAFLMTLFALNFAMYKTRISERFLKTYSNISYIINLYFCYVFVDIIVYFYAKTY